MTSPAQEPAAATASSSLEAVVDAPEPQRAKRRGPGRNLPAAIAVGGVLVVAGVLALVGAFVIEAKLVLPIIAIVITAVVLLCILAVGGKKWDQADNENVGYKDYRTRKREEEERRKREEEENNK